MLAANDVLPPPIPKAPKKFGLLMPPAGAASEPARWLPPELRGCRVFDAALIGVPAVQAYGIHKVRALKTQMIFGSTVEAGDELELPGNHVVEAIIRGLVESLDPRRHEEGELLKRAAELNIPIADRDNPVYAPPAPRLPAHRAF